MASSSIATEIERRRSLWLRLLRDAGSRGVAPQSVRELGIYSGAPGIWVDKTRTGPLTDDSQGISVGLLHTGRTYADDLASDGVLYHYPVTAVPGRDAAEIDATKNAARLGVPVFVIAHPHLNASTRDIEFGWVLDWDDQARIFLVAFSEEAPAHPVQPEDDAPFDLEVARRRRTREVQQREGQQRFKFLVLQRYGSACAVCPMSVPEVLEAAHLRPVAMNGSNDPRNGIVLCATHHRAFDADLFAFEPDGLDVRVRSQGPTIELLGIMQHNLRHLPRAPHSDAVRWLWEEWSNSP